MFIFLDTETTGSGPADRLCQIAFKIKGGYTVNELFNPGLPISIDAMTVHHITNGVDMKPLDAWKLFYQSLEPIPVVIPYAMDIVEFITSKGALPISTRRAPPRVFGATRLRKKGLLISIAENAA